MKFNNRAFFIFGTLILAFFLYTQSEGNTIIYGREMPQSGDMSVPAGIIAMWSGSLDSIPQGWILCDGTQDTPNTTDRFILTTNGSEEPGSIGGFTNHSHQYSEVPLHDHGNTDVNLCSHSHSYFYSPNLGTFDLGTSPSIHVLSYSTQTTGSASGQHSHATNVTGVDIGTTSDNMNLFPPFYKLAYIKKISQDPVIPQGVIIGWTGDKEQIPQGWRECDGNDDTPNLQGRFIMGVTNQNPGGLGGNTSHTHSYNEIPTHSHITDTNGSAHSHTTGFSNSTITFQSGPYDLGAVAQGYTEYEDVSHTHNMNGIGQVSCSTEEANHLPPYTAVCFIMNTQESIGFPNGCFSFWAEPMIDIPLGWNICNGTQGTLDLSEKFLKGSSIAEPVGTPGGNESHKHVYTEIPYHTHTIQSSDMRHRHSIYIHSSIYWIDGAVGAETLVMNPSDGDNTQTSVSNAPHLHNILPTGITSPETNFTSNFPPYIELIPIKYQNRNPTVSLLDPNGGEIISGVYEIRWEGSDPDEDSINYTLEYNINDTAWVEISTGLIGTSYNWDTTTFLYSEVFKVRVIGEDGFGGYANDESDANFTIDNRNSKRIPGYEIGLLMSLIMLISLFLAFKQKK